MQKEKGKVKKRVKITFSIPEEVNTLLHFYVEKGGLSEFVTRALHRAIKEKQEILKAAYAAANKDLERKIIIDDWESLYT